MANPFQPGETKIAAKLNALSATVLRLEREYAAGAGRSRRIFDRTIEYGKLTEAVDDTVKYLTLQPCAADGTDYDLDEVKILLQASQEARAVDYDQGQVLPYLRFILPAFATDGPYEGPYDGVLVGTMLELPSNAGKSKYMVLQLTDDNSGDNDPSLNDWDFIRWKP